MLKPSPIYMQMTLGLEDKIEECDKKALAIISNLTCLN